MGSHSLLQGIVLAQGSNLRLGHYRWPLCCVGLGLLPSPPAVCWALALPGTLEAEEVGAGLPPGAKTPKLHMRSLCGDAVHDL